MGTLGAGEYEETEMPRMTIGLGIVLIVLGLGGYFGTGRTSWTAMITVLLGLPLLVLGLAARRPAWRPHLMHAAVVVALLGFAGNVPTLLKAGALLGDAQAAARPVAVLLRSIMALLCLVYLGLAIHSFISARRRPRAAPGG